MSVRNEQTLNRKGRKEGTPRAQRLGVPLRVFFATFAVNRLLFPYTQVHPALVQVVC
ncbi:MAG: hypothetical protein WBP93_02305 [Pyrinomonadaceae bacterium]